MSKATTVDDDSEGPLDRGPWPSTLTAHVVTTGSPARIHGYDVEADLARHYGHADVVLLSLTGELPRPEASRAFQVAMVFLAPIAIVEAPSHAGVLARVSGVPSAGVVSVAGIALAEQSRNLVAEHVTLLDWLNAPIEPLPHEFQSVLDPDVESVKRLRDALAATGLEVTALSLHPTRLAALISLLHACGLVRVEQIESVLVLARLPTVLAEAFATAPASLNSYPMNVPAFHYEEAP